jgi:hypothetical protein
MLLCPASASAVTPAWFSALCPAAWTQSHCFTPPHSVVLSHRRVMRDLRPGARADLATYKVTTFTSDIRGADTTANVYIILHGCRGDGVRHGLATGPHDFERWERGRA